MGLCPFWQPGCFFPNKYRLQVSDNFSKTNDIKRCNYRADFIAIRSITNVINMFVS